MRMTPASVLAGKHDEIIPKPKDSSLSTINALITEIISALQSKKLEISLDLLCAFLQRRELLEVLAHGNTGKRFRASLFPLGLNGIGASLEKLVLEGTAADVSDSSLHWLMQRGVHFSNKCWQQWGVTGGQRVRALVNTLAYVVDTGTYRYQDDIVGTKWPWGYLLQGVLMGSACDGDDVTNCVNTAAGANSSTNTSSASSANALQQPECACRRCLAFFVVESGAVHEAQCCKTRNDGFNNRGRRYRSLARPLTFTMLDALKLEYRCDGTSKFYITLLVRLLGLIPTSCREAVFSTAKVPPTDPIMLTYFLCGGIFERDMGFLIYSLLDVDAFVGHYQRTVASKNRWAITAILPSAGGTAGVDDVPAIRCDDVDTTLHIIGELVCKWRREEDNEKRKVYWRMAVNTARFWLEVEVEKKKTVLVSIDGYSALISVIVRVGARSSLLSKASALEDEAVLNVVLKAIEEAGTGKRDGKAGKRGEGDAQGTRKKQRKYR